MKTDDRVKQNNLLLVKHEQKVSTLWTQLVK